MFKALEYDVEWFRMFNAFNDIQYLYNDLDVLRYRMSLKHLYIFGYHRQVEGEGA